MKKEYKAPMLNVINADIESAMMSDSKPDVWVQGKKSGRIYEDEEAAPAAATSKGFWDDEN